ncbi:cytochrome P450 [Roridomyces roridus]|uniref:Cytochrome P450 n=1 Tax=Roridomyces roridus TaxID=1738132 RepID=A0AAD7FGB2_9AGAR|nr:cytochrome P450 [Roridomyces roridus]
MNLDRKLVLAGLAALAASWFVRKRRSSGSVAVLPPGPKGLPLVGNVFQVPGKHMATYFRRLCEKYGGMVSLNMAGSTFILLGTMDLAKEVMEKRSTKFSDRPTLPIYRYIDPDQIYWAFFSGRTQFVGRKLTGGIMAGVRAGETEALQHFEALTTVNRILDNRGRGWFHEMERTSASAVLSAAFGLGCPTGEEPELKQIIRSLTELVHAVTPSTSIINMLPSLDLLPGPMPWRKWGAEFRRREDELFDKLGDHAKASGMNTWAASFANGDSKSGRDTRRLINIFSIAAIDTTTAQMQSFVLACLLHPSWIGRAQAQIDAVVGEDRMPTFQDRAQLPYVEAVVRETLRWRLPVRMGIPHQSTADDILEYKGQEYFIPKGSIVYAVSWAIEHDENCYENPEEFLPERFLEGQKLKSGYETSAFGFGRRVCPGVPFAERSMWINVAMILWAFDIHKSAHCSYGESDTEFKGEFTNPPLEFPAVFAPRSARREEKRDKSENGAA